MDNVLSFMFWIKYVSNIKFEKHKSFILIRYKQFKYNCLTSSTTLSQL